MKILFVNQKVDYSSSTSYSHDLATALMEQGDVVHLATLGGNFRTDFQGSSIETYRVRFNLFSYWKLIDLLREFDPDLIHVQSFRSFALGKKLATRLRKPFVLTMHRRPAEPINALQSIHSNYLRGVIVVNEVIREALVNDLRLPKSNIRVIKRGIRFPAPNLVEAEPGSVPVIGCVGRLVRDKGQHCLLEAARILLDRDVEAHFAIVGEGPEESRLRKQVRDLRLESHVTFAPPLTSRYELYSLFDIVALPVLSSGVGVTALEAMAAGKPLIASGVGELLHIVQDGRTGLLIPENNAEILAERIEHLLKNPDLVSSLRREGRSWAEKNFALKPMVRETRDYYEEVLSSLREERELGLWVH